MLVKNSRQAFFFKLFKLSLFAGFVDCTNWAPQYDVVLPPVSLPPSSPSLAPIQPIQPIQPNQPNQPDQPDQPIQLNQPSQPFPNSSFGCQTTCTMSVSVSRDSLLYFQQQSKMSVSQSLCTTGLEISRTRLVFPQSLAHPRLPSRRDSLRKSLWIAVDQRHQIADSSSAQFPPCTFYSSPSPSATGAAQS